MSFCRREQQKKQAKKTKANLKYAAAELTFLSLKNK